MGSVLEGLVRRFRPLAAAAALALAGLGGTAAPAATFAPANPYASGLSDANISVHKLIAFGDSFTRKNRRWFHNWAEQLYYDDLEDRILADFAVSGATAGTYSGSTNDFANQVTRWLGTTINWYANDLTVVYLGYNDIDGGTDPAGSDLASCGPGCVISAEAAYPAQLARIVNAGATGQNKSPAGSYRHILLFMPHNWGRSPYYWYNADATAYATMKSRTQVWDAFVAQTAQNNPNMIAVDLFTTMECVFEHPGLFGLTNVTDPLPSGGNPYQYLYDSGTSGEFHFGPEGHVLIKQVLQYYLTRAWNWSNNSYYKDPSNAQTQLLADLAGGAVFPGINCQTSSWPVSASPTVAAATARTTPSPQRPSPSATPSLQALEADPAHFGVAWARHLLASKAAAGSSVRR